MVSQMIPEKHISLRLQSGCLMSHDTDRIHDNSAEKGHWSFSKFNFN